MCIMADLSVRDVDGNLLTSADEIFSGAIGIGSGVYSGVIRLYNNYAGNDDVAHARNVKLYLSPFSGSRRLHSSLNDPYRNIRTALYVYNYTSGVCTKASQQSGADPGDSLHNINSGVYGDDYNIIYASGSNNYNEYRLETMLDSTVDLDVYSGALYIHVEYRDYLP